MFSLAQPFRTDRGYSDSAGEYTELRHALGNDDDKSAQQEIQWLTGQGKTQQEIRNAVGLSANGVKPELFTGSKDQEQHFVASLTPYQRTVYAQAQRDHIQDAVKLQSLLSKTRLTH